MGFSPNSFASRCLAAVWLLGTAFSVLAEPCAVCNKPLELDVILVTDRVARQKVHICPDCARVPERCFQCGLPVFKGYLELPDKRVLCERDRKDAILSDEEAKRSCAETLVGFTRSFGRIITLPEQNVNIELVDRVRLQALFALPGHDIECPNVWGFTRTSTNGAGVYHEIRLLSALPPRLIRSVSVHEYAHVWVKENVPPERRESLHRDAEEGFCELLALLLAEAQGDQEQVELINGNTYTRGQLPLFQRAQAAYGLYEIVEWMIAGADGRLSDDIGRVRLLQEKLKPGRTNSVPIRVTKPLPTPVSTRLQLKAVTWSKTRPLVVINNETFGLNDQAKVALGGTNVTIRCLAITPQSARIRVLDWNREEVLSLP